MGDEKNLRVLEKRIGSLKPELPRVVRCSSDHVELAWESVAEGICNICYDIAYKLQMNTLNNEWKNIYCGNQPFATVNNLHPKTEQLFRYKIIITQQDQDESSIFAMSPLAEEGESNHLASEGESSFDSTSANRKPSFTASTIELFLKTKSMNELKNKSPTSGESLPGGILKNKISSHTTVNGELNRKSSNSLKTVSSSSVSNVRYSSESVITSSDSGSKNNSKDTLHSVISQARIETDWSEVLTVCTGSVVPSNISLFLAVQGGFLDQAQSLVEQYPEMMETYNVGHFTPLMVATQKGNADMVKMFINANANVNSPSPLDHKTAIMIAAFHRKLTISKILAANGADMKARDINGLTALHYAVESNNLDTLKFFLSNGGDVSSTDNNGWTPLFTAVIESCDTDIVKTLVDHGSDIDAKDLKGLQPKQYAEAFKAIENVRKIVDINYAKNRALVHFQLLAKKVARVMPKL